MKIMPVNSFDYASKLSNNSVANSRASVKNNAISFGNNDDNAKFSAMDDFFETMDKHGLAGKVVDKDDPTLDGLAVTFDVCVLAPLFAAKSLFKKAIKSIANHI